MDGFLFAVEALELESSIQASVISIRGPNREKREMREKETARLRGRCEGE